MASHLTRRGALGAAAVVLASCGSGDPPPSGGAQAGSGAALLSSLLALEHAVIAAYDTCGEVLTGRALDATRSIRAVEEEHARRLAELIRGLGGEPPAGKSAAEYARTFPRLRSAGDALRFARHLEERQVRGYLQGLEQLPDPGLRAEAAELCADEGAQLATVRVLAGLPAAEGPFVTGAL